MRFGLFASTLAFCLVVMAANGSVSAADAAFQQWLQGTWPEAQKLGVSRATFDKPPCAGWSRIIRCPISPFPAGRKSRRRASRNSCRRRGNICARRSFDRLAARGKQLAAQYRDTLARIEKELRRARQCRAGDLGARDRLWPLHGSPRRHARAGDASLCRQAQGFLPQRIPARAEDAAGRRAARVHALVLGRRHGPDAIPAVGILQIRRRFRRRRPRRSSGIRCRTRSPRPPSSSPAKAGRRASPGRSRCGCRQTSIARSPSPATRMPIGEWLKARLRAGLWPQAAPRDACRSSIAAVAGRHLRPRLPDAEELLRAQGLQLFRSLRAVRRPPERPHRRRPSRSRRRGARASSSRPSEVEAMQQRLPRSGFTTTRSTARPACSRARRSAPIRRRTG